MTTGGESSITKYKRETSTIFQRDDWTRKKKYVYRGCQQIKFEYGVINLKRKNVYDLDSTLFEQRINIIFRDYCFKFQLFQQVIVDFKNVKYLFLLEIAQSWKKLFTPAKT